MKAAKWIAFGITILSVAVCLISWCVPWVIGKLWFGEAGAIGIIGGADGPTSIFVTRSSAPASALPVVFAVSMFSWLFFRWKSKNRGD